MRILQRMLFLFVILAASLLLAQEVRADSIPDRAYIRGVKGRKQSFSLSCESRSAVDLAAYWGVQVGEKKFLMSLPRSTNPDQGFVGNPNDAWGNIPPASYGVHAEPIAALLREYGLPAEARRGMKWVELQAEVAAGRPAIVWVIGQLWGGNPVRYTAPDGSRTIVARYEHTMLLVGYEPGKVYLLDAYTGLTQSYPLRTFLNSWRVLGRMAVISGAPATEASSGEAPLPPQQGLASVYLPFVFGRQAAATPTLAAEARVGTYRVRRGDYLADVARRFGVSWRRLADHNGIAYPYLIYPGQVLRIP